MRGESVTFQAVTIGANQSSCQRHFPRAVCDRGRLLATAHDGVSLRRRQNGGVAKRNIWKGADDEGKTAGMERRRDGEDAGSRYHKRFDCWAWREEEVNSRRENPPSK